MGSFQNVQMKKWVRRYWVFQRAAAALWLQYREFIALMNSAREAYDLPPLGL
jgi:hypothetical protein